MAGITDADIKWAEEQAGLIRQRANTGKSILVPALEFLRLNAGTGSEFYRRADAAVSHATTSTATHNAVLTVAMSLEGWADFVKRGVAELPVEAQARTVAATDLMEQVETLLSDRKMHPAMPVMLAGAALEEMLRSMVDVAGATPAGKPGINSYAAALQSASMITAQEAKDITSWAGLRNKAAHGEFDQIGPANARLMAQGINLFMQKHTP